MAGITEQPKEESLETTFEILKKNLHKSINAKKYLEDRKIYDLKIEAGFNRKTIKELRECVVFPLKDKYNRIVSLYGRSTGPRPERKKKQTATIKQLKNLQNMFQDPILIKQTEVAYIQNIHQKRQKH